MFVTVLLAAAATLDPCTLPATRDAAAWVYRERKVSDAALAEATTRWRDHLRCGLGASGDDRVFLRSFSALALSIAAAADLKQPWRDKNAFDADLDAALAYLAAEKDLRS